MQYIYIHVYRPQPQIYLYDQITHTCPYNTLTYPSHIHTHVQYTYIHVYTPQPQIYPYDPITHIHPYNTLTCLKHI